MKILTGVETIGKYKDKDLKVDWDELLNDIEKNYEQYLFRKSLIKLLLLGSLAFFVFSLLLDLMIGRPPLLSGNNEIHSFATIISALTTLLFWSLNNWISISNSRFNRDIKNTKSDFLSINKYIDIDTKKIIKIVYSSESGKEIQTLCNELSENFNRLLSYPALTKLKKSFPLKIENNQSRNSWVKQFLVKSVEMADKINANEIDQRVLCLSLLSEISNKS